MGIYSDLVTNAKSFTATDRVGTFLTRQAEKADPDLGAAFDVVDAVHTIPAYADTVADGTFTLTITLRNGEFFTTAGIAHNASAATIETAIDVAATAASITDWTNGDISVAAEATDLTDGDITLTFDGDSVTSVNHPVTTIDGTGLFVDGLGIAQTTAGNTTDTAEVQTISQFLANPTGGTVTVNFSLEGDGPVTIEFSVTFDFDATAAEIETAIDAAAVAAGYTTWSGEIAVTASVTDLTDGDIILTYGDGLLTQFANHDLATVDGSALTGALLADPSTVKTTPGQTTRRAWAVLKALGVITDTTPPEQSAPTTATAGDNLLNVPPALVHRLAQEAAFEDANNDTYFAIMDGVASSDYRKSPLVHSI